MTNSRKHAILIYIPILIAINLIVFYPSFFHSTRGSDHHNFLAETASLESLPELIKHSFSYTRSRKFMQGDKLLFRPLFYIFMAFEKWLFGYDFFYWQITAFILHMLVQWQLFRMLNAFKFSPWSFLIVLLNSVCFLPLDMIIRHHFSGYLLFEILALEAFYRLFRYLHGGHGCQKHFLIMLPALFLSSFFYECAILINLLFICTLYYWHNSLDGPHIRPARPHKSLIALPLLIYLIVNLADFFRHAQGFSFMRDGLTGSIRWDFLNLGRLSANFFNVVKILPFKITRFLFYLWNLRGSIISCREK